MVYRDRNCFVQDSERLHSSSIPWTIVLYVSITVSPGTRPTCLILGYAASAQLSAFEAERARVYRERFGAKEGGVSESSSRQRKPAENNKGVAHIADETAFASVLDNHSKVITFVLVVICVASFR